MSSPKSSVKRASAKQVNRNSASPSSSTKNRPLLANHHEIGQLNDGLPVREIDFAELSDGSIVDIIEDQTDPIRTRFAIFKSGQVRRIYPDGRS
jgi:hypothetical protein